MALDSQTTAVMNRLNRLIEQKPELAEPVAFYQAALPLLRQAQADVEPFTLPPETARNKLAAGIPLLLGEDLPLDPERTHRLFIHLCQIVETVGQPVRSSKNGWSLFRRGQPDSARLLEQAHNGNEAALRAAAAGQIRRAVEQNQLHLLPVWSALAAGDHAFVEATAREFKLEAELLRTLAQTSLKPALRAWAAGFKGSIDLNEWRRGQCPVCGSPPVLAEIQGKEGARHLRCGMCGANWSYPRLKCAFCANQDYRSLGYLTVEGEEEKYSLQTCEACRHYLKVVVTFEPTPVDLLPVEDLAILHLDVIAAERGYSR
ncbi:MAG: formate dehydrogenase accessory protein FdhE [Anaerolineae bacterium]|nr:formate dehydrogenase accessory protein FdhE [Anaerolineae bacterium]